MPDISQKTEAEQLGDLATLLSAIARKAAARAEYDPAAAEPLDLATRAETLAIDLIGRRTN